MPFGGRQMLIELLPHEQSLWDPLKDVTLRWGGSSGMVLSNWWRCAQCVETAANDTRNRYQGIPALTAGSQDSERWGPAEGRQLRGGAGGLGARGRRAAQRGRAGHGERGGAPAARGRPRRLGAARLPAEGAAVRDAQRGPPCCRAPLQGAPRLCSVCWR